MLDSMRVVQHGAYYIQLTCEYHELFEQYNIIIVCIYICACVCMGRGQSLDFVFFSIMPLAASIHYPGKLKAGLWVY